MHSGSRSKRVLFIILIMIAVALIGNAFMNAKQPDAAIPTPTPTPEPTPVAQVLVPCTASASAKPQKVAGWNTYLYPGIMTASTPNPSEKTIQEASYSLARIKEKTNQPNIFYRVETADSSPLPRDTKRILEICDANNQSVQFNTTADTKTEGASEGVVACITMMLDGYMQQKPGTYRLDGFIFTNGKWILTNRIEKVIITE